MTRTNLKVWVKKLRYGTQPDPEFFNPATRPDPCRPRPDRSLNVRKRTNILTVLYSDIWVWKTEKTDSWTIPKKVYRTTCSRRNVDGGGGRMSLSEAVNRICVYVTNCLCCMAGATPDIRLYFPTLHRCTKLYYLIAEAHMCVNDFAQGGFLKSRQPGFEPATSCSQVQRPYHCTTLPSVLLSIEIPKY